VRVVLDPNVIISALLSPGGAPAQVLRAWIGGSYELVVSPLLLEELERALGYRKLSDRITADEARELVDLLRHEGATHDDPTGPPPLHSPDPGDDYLIALAATADALLVSGDHHLLGLDGDLPVYSPARFLELVDGG
jgi:uncharacterized protein